MNQIKTKVEISATLSEQGRIKIAWYSNGPHEWSRMPNVYLDDAGIDEIARHCDPESCCLITPRTTNLVHNWAAGLLIIACLQHRFHNEPFGEQLWHQYGKFAHSRSDWAQHNHSRIMKVFANLEGTMLNPNCLWQWAALHGAHCGGELKAQGLETDLEKMYQEITWYRAGWAARMGLVKMSRDYEFVYLNHGESIESELAALL